MQEIPIPADVNDLLVDGEQAVAAYKTFRDSAIFTNKRLIVRDAQGLTGKKVEVYSLPYSRIDMCSSENAGKLLENSKGPSRSTGELDNRGSQFYLALYWAQELAEQTEDTELAKHFAALAKTLSENDEKIVGELNAVQGNPVDIGGYYYPDPEATAAVMRPSSTFNEALESAKQ